MLFMLFCSFATSDSMSVSHLGNCVCFQLLLIFQSLEVILLRTASDLSHFSVVGSTVVKKMVTNHMKLLQSSLNSENHRCATVCMCSPDCMVQAKGAHVGNPGCCFSPGLFVSVLASCPLWCPRDLTWSERFSATFTLTRAYLN